MLRKCMWPEAHMTGSASMDHDLAMRRRQPG